MFSLIITIISIALVAALAVSTLYFGGDSFNRGTAQASAATMVNQASQIAGANTLYAVDNGGTYADVMSDLTEANPSYLAAAPRNTDMDGDWSLDGPDSSLITASIEKSRVSVCQEINRQAGIASENVDGATSVTGYDDTSFLIHAADMDGVDASEVDAQFFCASEEDSNGDITSMTFYFK